MPFHQNATCTIRPEGLIAENYIDCDPGTAEQPARCEPVGGQPPTVPVTHTTEPVSLLDLFNIFNLPTRERFTVLINELGIGTAGRGQDLNDILRRANPTLALARQAIGILARQQRAARDDRRRDATRSRPRAPATPPNLQRFLDQRGGAHEHSPRATARLAARSRSHGCPGCWRPRSPRSSSSTSWPSDGTPLLQQLRAAAPSLNRVSARSRAVRGRRQAGPRHAVERRSGKAIPAIRDVDAAGDDDQRSTRRPRCRARSCSPRCASNLQQHGFVENFLSVTYYIAASLARFDATSHLLLDPADRPQQRPLRRRLRPSRSLDVQRSLWVSAGVQAGEGVR